MENSVFLDLMKSELFVLEKVDHPHITRCFEILETNAKFFIVMEFMAGGDLLGKLAKLEHFTEDHAAMLIH